MEITVVQDKSNENYLFVAVEHTGADTFKKMFTPARVKVEEWGQENGYGSIVPYFESLAGGTDTISVFNVSFISFIK